MVPLQAVLLFHNLTLLEPWRDEWFTLESIRLPLSRLTQADLGNPPLYFYLLHFWIQIPWPGDEVWKARAFSVLCVLAATVVLDRCWLRSEPRATRWMVLAMWVLSPCVLLYGRMARSYGLQIAVAPLALWAAIEWMDRPAELGAIAAFGSLAALLLYVHFLPGLAILGAVSIAFLVRPLPRLRTRVPLLLVPVAIVLLLYAPELRAIGEALQQWQIANLPTQVGGFFTDQIVRLAWWFISFSFGEAFSTLGLVLGAVLVPAILYALWLGVRDRGKLIVPLGIATAIGYVGTVRWVSFPFTTARMLFVLPFFFMLMAHGLRRMRYGAAIFVLLMLAYLAGDLSYFSQTGFLNKDYCVPYRAIANVINHESPLGGTVILADAYSSYPDPLLRYLNPAIPLVLLDDEASPALRAALASRPKVIWVVRHSHDTSPDRWVGRLETQLRQGRSSEEYDYLPYSAPERYVLDSLRGSGQPRYFILLDRLSSEGRPDSVESRPAR